MTTNITEIIAEIVSEIVAEEIRRLRSIGDEAMFRITGFSREESRDIAILLSQGFPPSQLAVVVGAKAPITGLDESLRLPANRTSTSYRNDARMPYFVFVEVDRFSDQQSLKNVITFSDHTILAPDDEHGPARRRDIVKAAWRACGGAVDTLPVALVAVVESVFDVLAPREHPSIRAWLDYVSTACSSIAGLDRAVDEPTVLVHAGRALDRLGLLPDPELASVASKQRRDRVEANHIARQRRDPRGKAIDADDAIALAYRTKFAAADGPLPETEQRRICNAVVAFMEGIAGARPTLSQWLQMFERDRARGLGTRLREHIEAHTPEQLEGFDDLDVTEDLDKNQQDAARKLLEDGTEVVGVLPTRLRRAVERLADPRSQAVADPLRHLLALFHELSEEREDNEPLHLQLARGTRKGVEDDKSLALFGFLYGPTLVGVAQDSACAGRIRLAIDPALTSVSTPPSRSRGRANEETEDDDDLDRGWAPLVLRLSTPGSEEEIRRFEWRPLDHTGLIAFRELVRATVHDHWVLGDTAFGAWAQSTRSGEPPTGGRITNAPDGATRRWLQVRAERLAEISRVGLDRSVLLDYARAWTELLDDVYRNHVPRGTPEPELTRFLGVDIWRAAGGVVMLATHPLRLRWIGEHLLNISKKLERAMEDGLRLNTVNDSLFFDQLENLSPHEQPAVLTMDDTFHVAVREDDWHEHFSVLRTSSATKTDWLADLDDSSIDELSAVVGEYIDAHPHKEDGVSVLLLVREQGARLLSRFLERISSHSPAPEEMTLHVFAPRSEFADIEKAVSIADDPDVQDRRGLPPLSVILHEWEDTRTQMPNLRKFDEPVDLAVVPNLFGIHTQALENTLSILSGDAAFEPWQDPATFVEASGDPSQPGQNVSRVLLPQRYDPALWQWSTANVRAFRSQRVGGTEIDYVALQVRFDQSRVLYDDLHRIAHWVVTLDPFVGRDQIEALPNRPDVILVRPRLGKSLAYTLIVSSSTGRDFLVGRLRSRLELDLPLHFRADAHRIATRLHEIGRQLSPGLVLRALGLGWATQELIGLSIARHLADQCAPLLECEGFVGWISLDDHASWFGHGKRTRADLARLALCRDGAGLWSLDILVAEAKMRDQVKDQIAEQQVRNTLELLVGALRPRAGDAEAASELEADDSAFWRAELLQALDQLPRTTGGVQSPAFSARTADGMPSNRISDSAREAFRSGKYYLASDAGRGFICLVTPDGRSDRRKTPDGYELWQVGGEEMASVLEVLIAERPPTTKAEACSTEAETLGAVDAPGGSAKPSPEFLVDANATASVELGAPRIDQPVSPMQHVDEVPKRRGSASATVEPRYQKLLDVFAQHQVSVVRPMDEPFAEGPGFYVFRVRPSQGVRPDAVRRYADDVKLALELPAEAQIRSYIDSGCVVFEVPKRDEERYFVHAAELWANTTFTNDRLYTPIGEDIRGRVIGIDFSSSDSPHLLIAGQTGSGKSIALETILIGLAKHYPWERLRMALVDPKATELLALENFPHLLAPIASDPADAIAFLEAAVEEMQRRRELFKLVSARDLPQYNAILLDQGRRDFLPWRLLVLDEYADLVSDKDDRKKIEGYLQRLSQKARASGIHIIVATQRPSADVISTVVRANLPAQLALRVRSSTESNVVMAEGGAESLAGKGDAFLRTARGTIRVQCGKVDS
jgi:S-DNA-T family DNA segregation ATPase FtsK/SpoIIIE